MAKQSIRKVVAEMIIDVLRTNKYAHKLSVAGGVYRIRVRANASFVEVVVTDKVIVSTRLGGWAEVKYIIDIGNPEFALDLLTAINHYNKLNHKNRQTIIARKFAKYLVIFSGKRLVGAVTLDNDKLSVIDL